MTAVPQTLYKCDRCLDVLHVDSTANPPAHKRVSGPEGWLQLRIGDDPSTPPSHLCPPCARGFTFYMQDRTITVGPPMNAAEEIMAKVKSYLE